jgi:hypothetical protein
MTALSVGWSNAAPVNILTTTAFQLYSISGASNSGYPNDLVI